jgi:hypothetical protein
MGKMPAVFLATNPVLSGNLIDFIAMRSDGYHAATLSSAGMHIEPGTPDRLALSTAANHVLVEQSGLESEIVQMPQPLQMDPTVAAKGESPALSSDGKWLAYLRSNRGRSQMWLRSMTSPDDDSHPITPSELNVFEVAFLPDGRIVFSAVDKGKTGLFVWNPKGTILDTGIRDARYPAASPDGKWLAYSRLEKGTWNLWIQDQSTYAESRVTNADCNDSSSSWLADSKTLIYASDCGRGLWLSALHRLRVIR